MKGLILAGGRGTRLRPITHTSAKQLVPIANKPILHYAIEHMSAIGIGEIGIIIGETGDEIRDAVGDGSRWGVRFRFIDQPEPLGLAHCVQVARPFLGDDTFVMYLGDNMLQHGLGPLVERFRTDSTAAARVLLCPVTDPQRFGIAELRDGRICRLVEKPDEPASDLAMVGAYLFTPAIHRAVDEISPSDRGELEIADAIQWLIDRGETIDHDLVDGWWLDTGKKDSLLEANRRVLEDLDMRIAGDVDPDSEVDGRVVIESGSVVRQSTIRGPAVIGRGTIVENSYVGPFTSVGEDVRIMNSEIENSVLLERVTIDGVPRLVDSLIGRDSEITRSTRPPRATRLLLGDHCAVDLA